MKASAAGRSRRWRSSKPVRVKASMRRTESAPGSAPGQRLDSIFKTFRAPSPFWLGGSLKFSMGTAYVAGAGNTRFGRLEGQGPLDLMADAAQRALADARLERRDIDGVLCGYATTLPHLMLSSLFSERFSHEPAYAHGVQLGGATGGAMLMLARELVRAGRCAKVLVVSAEPRVEPRVAVLGARQGHRHEHLSAITDTTNYGARDAARRALDEAKLALADLDYLAIYDSFTITLAILLEEIGFAPRGGSAERARRGDFSPSGPLPLNTHGGLLSFGHCGVAGGMAHAAEAYRQLAGRAAERQVPGRKHAFVHADGGVMSAHVSLVLGLGS